MSRRSCSLALALLALVLLEPGQSRAEREPGSDGAPRVVQLLEEHAERLGLAPDTLAAIREIASRAQLRTRELRGRRHAARIQLHRLLSMEPPDSGAVMQQVEVLGQLDTQLLQERVRVLLELRTHLTAAQLAELGVRAGR